MNYQEKVIAQTHSFLERQNWQFKETDEIYAKRFEIRHGKSTCIFKVFSNGTIQVQGATSTLKDTLDKFKNAVEDDDILAGEFLPFEIEEFPEKLQQQIPNVDLIIVHFLRESILCLKANSLLGCSFLLGAASEKAILLLIDAYTHAIKDEHNRTKFKERLSNKFISRAFEEFEQSFRSCKSKPTDPMILQDLDIKINSIFQFCRICRNEAGHPQISANLDKGVLLANMGQFVKYTEAIYKLIDYFEVTDIIV